MYQTLVDIKTKININQDNDNDDDNHEEDCKPTAQEKKQAEEAQDTSHSDNDGPMKKKRKTESFSLGCEVLCQHIKFDDGEPYYINTRKLQAEFQEAYQRVAELDAIRREHQCTIDVYEVCTIGIGMNLSYTKCISMHQHDWVSYNKIKKGTNYCFQLGQC